MKTGIVHIACLLLAGSLSMLSAQSTASGPIVTESFESDTSGNYEIWGAADPFNRVEAFKGNLELEGSDGFEGFGVYFKAKYDLSKGPVTVSFDLVRNSRNPGSEICVWFVNQYLIKGNPWDEGDFVRAVFNSDGNRLILQETSPSQRGMGKSIGEKAGAFTMGKKFHVDFVLDAQTVLIKIDGVQILKGAHHLPQPTGYIHLHDWNSLEKDIDSISNFSIHP